MKPESTDCPVCHAVAERTRQRGGRGFKYACSVCGSFEVNAIALGCGSKIPASAREDLRRLRAYGYQPRIDFDSHDGIWIGPSKSSRN